jgi:hypothetical protein
MSELLSDAEVIERIFHYVDNKSTDTGDQVWQEPVENYTSEERFRAEIQLLRSMPVPFCPSAALPGPGSYVARTAALTPLLVVRGMMAWCAPFAMPAALAVCGLPRAAAVPGPSTAPIMPGVMAWMEN